MAIDPNQLVMGQRLPGLDWILRGYLGQGGMGIVLDVIKPVGRGSSLDEGLPGAIKIIRPELAWRPEYVEGLFSEVRLLLKIDHPNIVRVLDFGVFNDGTPYVVMERLVGGTLRQLLDQFGPLPPEVAYQIIYQASEALDHAHHEGVIHRDFKLDNVFVHNPSKPSASKAAKPQIKVLDFGIAAFRADGGSILGTPKYMAPEQLRGEPVTVRTDVFATALVLYELLTGHLPWNVPPANIVQARLHMDPIPPSQYKPYISREMEQVILSGLARSPADRPRSCFEFADKLFALQHCQDTAGEINDTAPSLMTLTDVVVRARENTGAKSGADTQPGMTPPPLDGRSLENASPELIERESLALRRRFTMRMVGAPPHPPSAAAAAPVVVVPAVPPNASLHTPTDRVDNHSQTFPTITPAMAEKLGLGPTPYVPPESAPPVAVIPDARPALAAGQRDATPAIVVASPPAPPVQTRAEYLRDREREFAVAVRAARLGARGQNLRDAGSISGTIRSNGPALPSQSSGWGRMMLDAARDMVRPSFLGPAAAIVAAALGIAAFAPRWVGNAPPSTSGPSAQPAEGPVPEASRALPPPVQPTASAHAPGVPSVSATGAPTPAANTSAGVASVVGRAPPRPKPTATPPARAPSASAANDEWRLLE
jgi:serine/threonine protein kinase